MNCIEESPVRVAPIDRLQYANGRVYAWLRDKCCDITDNKKLIEELERYFLKKCFEDKKGGSC